MDWPIAFDAVFSRLVKLKRFPSYWKCLCPAHEDVKPSLSVKVTPDGKRLIVKCHAFRGCRFDDIVSNMGLRAEDFYVNDHNPTDRRPRVSQVKPQIEKTYDYLDEAGELLYQAVRYRPKDFKQRRPNPDRPGEWIWNLEGVRRVLYGLPAIIEKWRQRPDRPIFVLEGEKSVDNWVSKLDVLATCNVGGAGKWLPDYTQLLKDRRVIVLGDFDPVDPKRGYRPGWAHVVKVCNSLSGVARSVKGLVLPGLAEREDPDDWLDRQWSADRSNDENVKLVIGRLADVVNKAQDWTPIPELENQASPFAQAVSGGVATHRSGYAETASREAVLGRLRAAYVRVEMALYTPSGAVPDDALVALGVAAQTAAEDLGVFAPVMGVDSQPAPKEPTTGVQHTRSDLSNPPAAK